MALLKLVLKSAPFWNLLWKAPGRLLAPSWRVLGPKMATKMGKKPFLSGSQNGADFWISFKRPIPQLRGRPGGMRGARGRLQRGCRKSVIIGMYWYWACIGMEMY